MNAIAPALTHIERVDNAMTVLADPEQPLETRIGMYALIHQIQLRMNRALKAVKDDLIVGMDRSGQREIGPVSIKASAGGVEWPCNDEGNWTDSGVQEAMADLARVAPDYIHHIPDHYEIRTAELGAGVAMGDPIARDLHAECKRQGWRREEARRLSLAVKEVKP